MTLYWRLPSLVLLCMAIKAIYSFDEARVPRKLVKISSSDNNRIIKPYVYLKTDYDHHHSSFSGVAFDDSSLPTETTRQSLFGSKKKTSTINNNEISTVSVSYEATMKIKIPRSGVSGDSMLAAAFCVAYFSTLLPATFLRTVPRALRMAMLPFWAAGGGMGKRAFVDPYLYTTFSIGRGGWWSIQKKFLGVPIKKTKGKATELKGAVCEVAGLINGVPKNQLRLVLNKRQGVVFGIELSDKELQVLAENINSYVEKLKAMTDVVSLG
jgi:hypothetical protein